MPNPKTPTRLCIGFQYVENDWVFLLKKTYYDNEDEKENTQQKICIQKR